MVLNGMITFTNSDSMKRFSTIPVIITLLFITGCSKNELERIVEETGAKTCLISSWGYEGEEKMRQLWKDRKMPGELLAVCCNSPIGIDDFVLSCENPTPEMMVGKGRDVKAFLSAIKVPYQYVILDDVPDFYSDQMNHYIQVNPIKGIDEDVARIALNILGY